MISPGIRRRLRYWLTILIAFVLAVATIVVSGRQLGYFQAISPRVTLWIVVALAIATFIDRALSAISQTLATRRTRAEARAQKTLVLLLTEISEQTSTRMEFLGVNLWVPRLRWVKKTLRAQKRIKLALPLPRHVLVRVLRFRLNDFPQPSKVAWVRGKGAIGKCWDTRRPCHRDWRTQLAQNSNPDLSEAKFQRLTANRRDGFSHSEFVGISNKYREVLAVPILSVPSGALVGVMSLDVMAGAGVDQTVLGDQEIVDRAEAAAPLLTKDLKPLYAQS